MELSIFMKSQQSLIDQKKEFAMNMSKRKNSRRKNRFRRYLINDLILAADIANTRNTIN